MVKRSKRQLEQQKRELEQQKHDADTARAKARQSANAAKRAKERADRNASAALREKKNALALQRLAEFRKAATERALVREKRATSEARAATLRREAILYPNLIERAGKEVAKGNLAEARRLLSRCSPELRGSDWRFLVDLAQPPEQQGGSGIPGQSGNARPTGVCVSLPALPMAATSPRIARTR